MNWRRGFTRLWLVSSLFWVISVGWLAWPGDALPEWSEYWYYRLARSDVLDERRASIAAASRQRDKAVAEIRSRYDATRLKCDDPESPHRVTSSELRRIIFTSDGKPIDYQRKACEISDTELDDLEKVLYHTTFMQPESKSLERFALLENRQDFDGSLIRGWVSYTLLPPLIIFVVGASVLWALRSFRTS
jgi:hypothetical protein